VVTGMMREYAKPTLARFAIPLCTPDSSIDALTEPFITTLKQIGNIPDMKRISNMPGITRYMHATYQLV
jgi:hypothetical protein